MGLLGRVDRAVNRAAQLPFAFAMRRLAGLPVPAAGTCLVLAPHPDDETLGCAATILATTRRGGRAVVAVASDGRHGTDRFPPEELVRIRHDELLAATAALGVRAGDVREWGFEDGTLDRHEEALASRIQEVVAEAAPDLVLVTAAADPHADHRALGRAARRALAGQGVPHYEYVIWGWERPAELLWRAASRWRDDGWGGRPVRSPSGAVLGEKLQVVARYRSQMAASAASLGLPPGDGGPFTRRFLSWFLQGPELYLPVRGARLGAGSSNTGRPAGLR